MRFLRSEKREAILHADKVLERLHGQLSSRKLQELLGQRAALLIEVLDMAYVPNLENDIAVTPKKFQDGDFFPFMALEQGQEVWVESMRTRMPVQELHVDLSGYTLQERRSFQPVMSLTNDEVGFTRAYYSNTYARRLDDTFMPPVTPLFRPAVAVRHALAKDMHRASPQAVVLHELSHAVDKIHMPVLMSDRTRSAQELTALGVEAAYWHWRGERLDRTRSPLARTALHVEAIRREHSDIEVADNLAVPDEILEAIQEAGLEVF